MFTPHRLFICLGTAFGLLFLFLTPPFQTPDEDLHFFRAYEITQGGIIEIKQQDKIGDFLPVSISQTTKAFEPVRFHAEVKVKPQEITGLLNLPLDRDNKTFIEFPSTALYPPTAYLPQIVGIGLGKIFNLSPLVLMYLGRLASLLAWLFLIYYALKIIPVGKWLMFLLALLPMGLFQAASLSADVLTNGLAFLGIALFLRFALTSETLNSKKLFLLLTVGLLLSLSKPAYALVPLVFLFIPLKNFANKKTYHIFSAWLIGLIVLTNLAWFYGAGNLSVPTKAQTSPAAQLEYISAAPLEYAKTILRTIPESSGFYLHTFIGWLGWLDTPLPLWIIYSYYAALLLALGLDNNQEPHLPAKIKLGLLFIALSTIVIILTSMYLIWSPVGGRLITGVQGRYFIPIAPLLLLPFLYNRRWIKPIIIPAYSLVVLGVTIFILIQRYYFVNFL